MEQLLWRGGNKYHTYTMGENMIEMLLKTFTMAIF